MKSPLSLYLTGMLMLLALSIARTTTAFLCVSPHTQPSLSLSLSLSSSTNTRRPTSLLPLQAAGGGGGGKNKGFGSSNSSPQAESKKKPVDALRTTTTTTTTTTNNNTSSTSTKAASASASAAASSSSSTASTASTATKGSLNPGVSQQNPGQKALEDMRRVRAEEKDAELRAVRALKQTDAAVKEAPAVIPERVAQRMGKRMLPFVGVPFVGGITAFSAFYYYAVVKNMEFQPVLVAGSTIGILVFSLLGITYSVMSASWDPDREGDFLGTQEFSRNLDNIREGLGRSRENALLRDKMESLSGEELQRAMDDLERKEVAEAKRMSMKSQTLTSKLKDELE